MPQYLCPHQSADGAAASFSLRAKSRLRRLRFDTRLRAQPRGESLRQHRIIPALRLKHRSGGCGTASALPKCSIMSGCGTRIVLRGQKPLALCDRCPCFGSLYPPLAALTFAASSIICAFGLAAAAPRSPYRHLELCGIALIQFPLPARPKIIRHLKRQHDAPAEGTGKGDAGQAHPRGQHRSSGSAQPRL